VDVAAGDADNRGIEPGPYVLLTIRDTGAGMDAVTGERIFEPFFTTKEQGKGTGLGLSTVLGIVEQSKGYIRFESQVGQGTTFKVYLPRSGQPPEAAPTVAHEMSAYDGSESILVVEDDEQVRAMMHALLERHGYTVLEAQNADEALTRCESATRIDLLLVDIVLPSPNGQQLAERLLRSRPDMKVLFMSGYAEPAVDHLSALGYGAVLLTKPVIPAVLLRKVREVLSSTS
jgi:CheY-like chemotaxis protein